MLSGGDRTTAGRGAAGRRAALVVTALVGLVVLWPVLAHPDTDGFPLSTYPMFSSRRPAVASFTTVVGVDGAGRSRWLSPDLANGTREVVQAAVVVDAEVRAGRARQLCADVAARLADRGAGGSPGPGPDAVEWVEVVTLRLDVVGFLAAGGAGAGPERSEVFERSQPFERSERSEGATVHAGCPVRR